ncbi:Dolichyl-phosphate-mannose-protein mannosyltransferase [Halogranum rubrum]|uniref:Dolichyl-phosphate-mannose-protein mannosyltransferase n=1 Tax=Halogranum rubrum TaxID=553466 RepID=A0A1I4BQG0_9EURY|nr:glycosyltransferase family 39 protein [Halogranum rubrum]SFK70269.1 Dolichyl-phosphate-mannose-protein mannosyltransferase [Halogranum rubrum]
MRELERFRRTLPLVVVLVAAAGLRLYGLAAESLWTDELVTVEFVAEMTPLELLVQIPQVQPHLPLYYLLLDGWIGLAGNTPASMRLLSALFGIAAVVAMYLLGRRLVDHHVGLVAAALLAFSRFHIYYAQEVRMYSLLTLLSIVSFYALVRLRETPTTRHVLGYVVSAGLLIATHFFAVLVVLAQVTYLVVRLDAIAGERFLGLPTRRLKQAYALGVLVSPLVILAAVAAIGGAPRYHYIPYPSVSLVVATLTDYLGYPRGTNVFVVTGVFVAFVGTALLAVVRFGDVRRLSVTRLRDALTSARFDSDAVDRDALSVALLWFGVPFGGLVALSYLVTPLFWPRYTIAASLGFFLLVALGVRSVPNRHLRTALAVVLVVGLVPSVALYHTNTDKEQWRAVGNTIDERAESGDFVLVMDQMTDYGVEYYVDREDVTMASVVAENSGTGYAPTPTSEIANVTDDHGRTWLVFSHASDAERQRVLDVVNDTRTQAWHHQFVKVEVYLFVPDESGAETAATTSTFSHSPRLSAESASLNDGRRSLSV